MANITIKIPTGKLAKAKEGFLEIYPNGEMTENVDEVENFVPILKYTDNQWIKEKVRRNLIRDIHRGLNVIAKRDTNVMSDDALVE